MEDRKHDNGDDDGRDGQEMYRHIFRRLMALSQASYRNMEEVTDRLSQEMLAMTGRRASLILTPRTATYEGKERVVALSFPICCRDKWYGRLQIACLDGQPAFPALPYSVAHLLAEMCGVVLYTCEITVSLQRFRDQFDLTACQPLTKRETEVFVLMKKRLSDQKIAQALSIRVTTVCTYQRTIYSKLGVRNKQDAILVGWLLEMFSPSMEKQSW